MDSQTHWELAIKFLNMTRGPQRAAIASIFPQIDRRPSTLHRLYAHSVFKARFLSRMGMSVLFGGDVSSLIETDRYSHGRFLNEELRFRSYLKSIPAPATFAHFDDAELNHAIMAFVSHLYLDTFNQPTQAFNPVSVFCCGQWELWEKLGEFRLRLYTTDTIERLRLDLFANSIWNESIQAGPSALTEAMLIRMCVASQGRIPEETVDQAMESLDMTRAPGVEEICVFLARFEELLGELHLLYLSHAHDRPARPSVSSAA